MFRPACCSLYLLCSQEKERRKKKKTKKNPYASFFFSSPFPLQQEHRACSEFCVNCSQILHLRYPGSQEQFLFKSKKVYCLTFGLASQVALVVKNLPANATDMRYMFGPWVGKIPLDRGACWVTLHRVTKSPT